MTAPRVVEMLSPELIDAYGRLRSIDTDAVRRLAESMRSIGLRTPISVRATEAQTQFTLMTGAHRLAAAKQLGWEKIECFVHYDGDEIDAQLWEIAENLHRAELTALERDEQVALWVRLNEQRINASQTETHNKRGQKPGGVNAAARELGIAKPDAHRAVKVASLSDEAKTIAKEIGLDDNRTALLEAARLETAEDQVAALKARKEQQQRLREANTAARDANREQLPQAIRDREAAKAQARSGTGLAEDGFSQEDRVAELEEALRVLEAEAEALRAENKLYAEMRVQFQQGGYDKVIAGKNEEIRVLLERLVQESADKSSWMKQAKYWKAEAAKLGWSADEFIPIEEDGDDDWVIPLDDGEGAHG